MESAGRLKIRGASSWFRYAVVVSTAVSSCAWLGCGGRPGRNVKLAPVAGKVTYRDKPLDHGQIVFVHDSGEMAASEIAPDGTYKLTAAVGINKVMVECTDAPNLSSIDPNVGRPLRIPKSFIPEKYQDYQGSGLKVDVIDGTNNKDWALKD